MSKETESDVLDLDAVKNVRAAQNGQYAGRNVGYTVVPNAMPASQEAAPCLGRTQTERTACEEDELEDIMIAEGCTVDKPGIRLVMNATAAYVMDRMKESPNAIDLGYLRLVPVMDGTLPWVDAEFDPTRNSLYVAVQPSEGIRNALSRGTPSKVGDATAATPSLVNVQGEGLRQRNTIQNGQPFDLLGAYITYRLPGDRAEMKLPDGTTVPVALESQTAADGCQRIVGRLTQSVDACTGVTVTLWTHGLRTEGEAIPVVRKGVTILPGEVPPVGPVPTLTEGHSQAHEAETGKMFPQFAFILSGTNLTDASVHLKYVGQSGTAHDETLTPDNYEISEDGTELVIGPGGIVNAMESTQVGDTITVEATTAGGTASYDAEHAVNE